MMKKILFLIGIILSICSCSYHYKLLPKYDYAQAKKEIALEEKFHPDKKATSYGIPVITWEKAQQ